MKPIGKYLGLFTDHYELTMAEGYLLAGREEVAANFDYFFRKNPFRSGFTVFAGLQDLAEMVQQFKFDGEALDYLHKRGFHSDFLEFLKGFSFTGNLYAPNEGEVVFPEEPVARLEGTLIETQLLETLVLNTLNFQSLIATKANRLRHSAGDRLLMDFGMRRAQGWAALHATRAAAIGGVDSTSNVLSAFLYGLPSSGTQAHSWIQSFGGELTAFREFAKAHPGNCVLLVDTYDTLKSGVPNAITVAKEMASAGKQLLAIRLDSGDLAYLSKAARKLLDRAGLEGVKILASNQLDEYIINSLVQQGAPIDGFGVGTSLVTGQQDGALDGVYKLSHVGNNPTIKLSEDINKTTLPGKKKIVRCIGDNDKFYADAILLEGEDENGIDTIYHPQYANKKSFLAGLKKEPIASTVFENGKFVMKEKGIKEIAEYRKHRVAQLSDEHKRFEFPHIYKVGISNNLMNMRDGLLTGFNKK